MQKAIQIALLVGLVLLMLFLELHDDLNISKEEQFAVSVAICFVGTAVLIIDSFRVMVKNEYTTSLFIVLSNITAAISLIAATYLAYKTYGEYNLDVLHRYSNYFLILEFLFVGAIAIRQIFKRQNFKRVNSGEEQQPTNIK